MSTQSSTNTVPPALRGRPKHGEIRNVAARRLAGGAVLGAAIAGGAFVAGPLAGLAGVDNVGSTATAQAAPCVTGLFCDAVNGGGALFGGSIGALGDGATQFGALTEALDPLNLIGPGGLLIGNGLDATPRLAPAALPATVAPAACFSAAAVKAPTPRQRTPQAMAVRAA